LVVMPRVLLVVDWRFVYSLLVDSYQSTLRRNLKGPKLQNKCIFNFFQNVRRLNLLQYILCGSGQSLCVCIREYWWFMSDCRNISRCGKCSCW